MIAVHFGQTAAPLFGVYHPAAGSRPDTHAVVVCNAFGAEYMVSHLVVRRIAIALAERGHDVLRFDYSGTGDSAGDQDDISLPQWSADIDAAADELADMSGRPAVTLLGVRLGAGLACDAAMRRPERVRRVVAWDAVLRGEEYLGWMEATERSRRPDGAAEAQALGHPLPMAFREQLRAFDAVASAGALGPRLVHASTPPAPTGVPSVEGDLFDQALKTGDLIVDPNIVAAVLACFVEARR